MNKNVYKSVGNTPKEAFEKIWDLIQFTDDLCMRQENGNWCVRIAVATPTKEEREQFEIKEANIKTDSIYHKNVVDCDLSIRALCCLKAAGIKTVGDLCEKKKSDLLMLRNFGKKTIMELNDFMDHNHLEWK